MFLIKVAVIFNIFSNINIVLSRATSARKMLLYQAILIIQLEKIILIVLSMIALIKHLIKFIKIYRINAMAFTSDTTSKV